MLQNETKNELKVTQPVCYFSPSIFTFSFSVIPSRTSLKTCSREVVFAITRYSTLRSGDFLDEFHSPSWRASTVSGLRPELVDGPICGCDSERFCRARVLRRLQISLHEVFLVNVSDLSSLDFVKLVVQAASFNTRNLVLGMRTSDLISPLHFLSLDHETTNLLLSVLSGCERDNEVCALLAIWLKLAILGVNGELLGRICGEVSLELRVLLHVI